MKHSRISFIERAAELTDFGAPLLGEATAPAPVVAPAPGEAVEPAAPPPSPLGGEGRVRGSGAREDSPTRPLAPTFSPKGRGREAFAPIDRTALAEAGFIVPGGPVTGLAEEFRLVKRQLLATIERHLSQSPEKRRSVLVCSGQPREGKSFCAVNLALSLAGERDTEVLLVDGDVAKHDMLALLGIEGGAGLVDALADPAADPEAFVIRTDVPGLVVLPAGRQASNVPELLASERTREVLARLVEADPRRIILFDSPPVLMDSVAATLAAHVGQALVVVRADATTEADLRETVGLLSACDHVGLILNGAGLAVTGRKFGAYYEGRDHAD